jgi:hypothetical protein
MIFLKHEEDADFCNFFLFVRSIHTVYECGYINKPETGDRYKCKKERPVRKSTQDRAKFGKERSPKKKIQK